jgi:hypothetical protein
MLVQYYQGVWAMVGIKILVGKENRIYDIEVEEENENNYASALLEEEERVKRIAEEEAGEVFMKYMLM